MHGPHSVSDTGHCTVIHCDTVCRWLTNEKQRKTDIRLTDQYKMFRQTDKSWRDYRALNQNWSYQPTLAGRAIYITITQ